MSFRFVHAADLHLDAPFRDLQISDPDLRVQLQDASLDALDRLVDLTLRESALFLVLAGDLYDGARHGLRARKRLVDACRRLSDAGVWTFIASGNHDPLEEGWSAVRNWPERVVIFPSGRVQTHTLTAPDGSAVHISGISYERRATREPLHLRFPVPKGPGLQVAVLHANVGSAGEHEPYSPCRLEDLERSGHHAWLLGHIHRRDVLLERPLVAYPGNLQGRSFKPAECGPKGALVVEVAGTLCTPRFEPLAPIWFEDVAFDASACAEVGELVDALQALVPAPDRLVLVRARVDGASAVYRELMTTPDGQSELLRLLRDQAPPGVRWMEVELNLRPPIDLDALAGMGDLRGELVRLLRELQSDPVATKALIDEHKALRGHDLGNPRQLLEEAALLALTLFDGEV